MFFRYLFHTVPEEIKTVVLCHRAVFLAYKPQFLMVPVGLQDKITQKSQKFFHKEQIAVVFSVIFPVLKIKLPLPVDKGIDHISAICSCPSWKKDQFQFQKYT